MTKLKLIFLLNIMCVSLGYAHDADKAFFDIIPKEKTIVVYAELPWTIRATLISFDSNFVNLKKAEEVNAVFFNYAKEKLELYDHNGNTLKLLEVVLNKPKGHSHSTKYTLTYDGSDIAKIQNEFMLEQNKNQRNYHFFTDDHGKNQKIITHKSSPAFEIEILDNKSKWLYYILGGIMIVVLISGTIFWIKKNK